MIFKSFYNDINYLENKYHKTNEPFDGYQRRNYHGYEYDKTTGMDDDGIRNGLRELSKKIADNPHPVVKAHMVKYVLENTRIDVNEHDYFVGISSWGRLIAETTWSKWQKEVFEIKIPEVKKMYDDFNKSCAVKMWPDYDHVVPSWDSILSLGFPGILERVRTYRKMHEAKVELTQKQKAFFDGMEITYEAIIAIIDRMYNYACCQQHEKAPKVAACLKQLRDGKPTNIYEAMQLIYIYFVISDGIECYQVNSLGHGLDDTLYSYYVNDIKNNVYTRDEIKELLAYFMKQWSAIGNVMGQPMYLGGTDINGNTKYNDLSYDILDVYEEIGIFDPKIQLKVNTNSPSKLFDKVFNMIRSGQTSFVFCCEPAIWRSAMSYGASFEEARTIDITGCYEISVRENEVGTAVAYINALKPVEYVFSNGFDKLAEKQMGLETGDVTDFKTFDEFYFAVLKQWEHLIETSIKIADGFEPYLTEINPSSMYSATMENGLRLARDAYQDGAKFNTSIVLNCGIGSMADSIMAVKKFVFDNKEVTMSTLKKALDANWVGYEPLRAKILNNPYKYGNNEPETDRYASALATYFAMKINNRPNSRGGVYKTTTHPAMMFAWLAEKTLATPDGRKAGDEMSKNSSPAIGADKKGITAMVLSAVKLMPYQYNTSFCLDVFVHPSAIQGEDGLSALKGILMTYMNNGGVSMQFNVFSSEQLRDAQKHPEKYENLQVRVCGWNNRWNDLSEQEQEAYIQRVENLC